MKTFNKEWCSITLMNKFKICLKFEFSLKQADLLMIALKLTDGIGFSVLGMTIGLDWRLVK